MAKPPPRSRVWAAALITVTLAGVRSAWADTFEVTLEGISFWHEGQQNIEIDLILAPGDTVRWLWVEGFHNVVSGFPDGGDEGDLFTSGPPTDIPGTTFEFTFTDPGLYGYHCHPHGAFGMVSSVTVVPAPGSFALLAVGGLAIRRRRRRVTKGGRRGRRVTVPKDGRKEASGPR